MAERPDVYGGFLLGRDEEPHNVLVNFNGPDTYIADNNGQTVDQFWQEHNHYRTGGWDGGGGRRDYYSGPGH
jgi:hypothetical protein